MPLHVESTNEDASPPPPPICAHVGLCTVMLDTALALVTGHVLGSEYVVMTALVAAGVYTPVVHSMLEEEPLPELQALRGKLLELGAPEHVAPL